MAYRRSLSCKAVGNAVKTLTIKLSRLNAGLVITHYYNPVETWTRY